MKHNVLIEEGQSRYLVTRTHSSLDSQKAQCLRCTRIYLVAGLHLTRWRSLSLPIDPLATMRDLFLRSAEGNEGTEEEGKGGRGGKGRVASHAIFRS